MEIRNRSISRRTLLTGAGLLSAACAGSACQSGRLMSDTARGRLLTRPGAPPQKPLAAGLHTLPVPNSRNTLLYVPSAVTRVDALPLIVSLHGAGGNARQGIERLHAEADEHGFSVLALSSRGDTWDVIAGEFGPDVAVLDQALLYAFQNLKIDPASLAISGFSDGASYALSLGLPNGDLFHYIAAFSPGFMTPPAEVGKPRIFISHGTRDEVLPIDRCSRVLVPKLRRSGYAVEYREFDGPHTVPKAMRSEAIRLWRGAAL